MLAEHICSGVSAALKWCDDLDTASDMSERRLVDVGTQLGVPRPRQLCSALSALHTAALQKEEIAMVQPLQG